MPLVPWSLLEFEGKLIGFNFGFDHNVVLVWCKPSFDITMANRSPGKVLLRHIIAFALDSGRQEPDFTVGDESFERRYRNSARKNTDVVIFNQTLASYQHLAMKQLRGAVRRAWRRFSIGRKR